MNEFNDEFSYAGYLEFESFCVKQTSYDFDTMWNFGCMYCMGNEL